MNNEQPKDQKNKQSTKASFVHSLKFSNLGRKKLIIVASVVLALLIAVIVYAVWANKSKNTEQSSFTIGETTITSEDLDSYAAELSKYSEFSGGTFVSVTDIDGDKLPSADTAVNLSPSELALEDLTMLAALELEATNRGMAITEEDIDTVLATNYAVNGSKEAHLEKIRLMNVENVARTRAEIEAYKLILKKDLIAVKDLFMVRVSYDTPYHYGLQNSGIGEHEKATNILNDTFKPLLEDGTSKEEISKRVDINRDDPAGNPPTTAFEEKLLVIAKSELGYSHANPVYKDGYIAVHDLMEGEVDIDDKIKELSDVGQVSDVFAATAGFHAVLRLEGKTIGSYNSWKDFLQSYTQDATKTTLSDVIKQQLNNAAMRVDEAIKGPVASAQVGGCGAHEGNFHVSAWLTGGPSLVRMPVNVSVTVRQNGGCTPKPNGDFTIDSDGVVIPFNCYNPEPNTFAAITPAGYLPAPEAVNGSTHYKTNGNPGTPQGVNWTQEQMNAVQQVPVDVFFKRDVREFSIQGQRVLHDADGVNPIGAPNGAGTTSFSPAPQNATSDSTHSTPSRNPFKAGNYNRSVTVTAASTITTGGRSYTLKGYSACTQTTTCHPTNISSVPSRTSYTEDLSTVGGFVDLWWHYELVPVIQEDESYVRVVVRTTNGTTASRVDMTMQGHSLGTCGWDFSVNGSQGCTGTQFGNQTTGTDSVMEIDRINSTTYRKRSTNPFVVTSRRLAGYPNSASTSQLNCDPDSCSFNFGRGYGVEVTLYLEPIPTPPPTSSSCPSLPNTNIAVSLPDRSPNNNGVPGSTRSYGANHTRYQRKYQTEVIGTEDISPDGGADVNAVPGNGNYDLRLISQSYQQANIDYRIFVDECPYDRNQGQVRYDSHYTSQNYSATQYAYTITYYYHRCPSGYYSSTINTSSSHTCSRYYSHYHQSGYYCGYFPSGNARSCTHGHTEYASASSSVYDRHYYYNYVPTQSPQDRTAYGTADGTLMQPCYPRTYDTTSVTLSAPTLTPDRESPNRSSVSGAINIRFDVFDDQNPNPSRARSQLRRRSSINNYRYNIDYRIGSGPWQQSTVGTTTVNASSNSRVSSGSISDSEQVAVSVPPLRAGDRVCWRIYVPATGQSSEQGRMNYLGNRIDGSGIISREACSVPVVNWPYFKVFGSDVVSGGQFGTCSLNPGNGIRARSRPGEVASSTQYAAFALSSISGFGSSAINTPNTSPASFRPAFPKGLSFANITNPYGGNYGANDGVTCVGDYFGSQPDSTTTVSPTTINTRITTANDDPTKLKYYRINSGATISGPINVPNSTRVVVYVDGNLQINSNIVYSTNWQDREDVPYVMIIARNITISRNVTQLDGVYVAQPNGASGGTINTCDVSSFTACVQPLVVNGAFVAERVNLLRTRGSLRDAVDREGATSVGSCSHGTASTAGTPGGRSCAAEIFNFSPEVFLSVTQLLTPEDSFIVDSFTNLPPSL